MSVQDHNSPKKVIKPKGYLVFRGLYSGLRKNRTDIIVLI